jgi:enolase
MNIKKVSAKSVLDSRGNPTVEVKVFVSDEVFKASVPSGASTGVYEAVELRDEDGGVQTAVENVKKIIGPAIVGMDCCEQVGIDEKMIKLDGSENKSKLGANAILGVSMAVCRAGAFAKKMELYEYIAELSDSKVRLPVPFFNVINGGRHAKNNLLFQEFMVAPVGVKSFEEGFKIGKEIYKKLGREFKGAEIGDEGGYAPKDLDDSGALKLLKKIVEGYDGKVKIGLDIASSEFFRGRKYNRFDVKRYGQLIEEFGIVSIEDCFEQNDWANWIKFTSKFGSEVQIVGDDLLVTNVKRIKKAVSSKACNALLLKINQIGTISEAVEAFRIAREVGWKVMVSHRSGETKDDFIADLAVGLGCGQIKSGAPFTRERLVKYERLLEIEKGLKNKGVYGV